ncbi:MAG: hypothetical protein EBU49_08780, partial [Proteobacteria bacterium]|nr:hypothetical protein [Pseudomonadota bacterium]
MFPQGKTVFTSIIADCEFLEPSTDNLQSARDRLLVECLRNNATVLRSFAGRSSLATYLAVIARRVVARRLNDTAREAAPRVPQPRHRRADVMATDETAQAADREHVESLLRGLHTDEARLVRLHHLEHRS